jgi:hypothetical protein
MLNLTSHLTPAQLHEYLRKQCWIQTAAAVSSATNCRESSTACIWANYILEKFDEQFPAPTDTTAPQQEA